MFLNINKWGYGLVILGNDQARFSNNSCNIIILYRLPLRINQQSNNFQMCLWWQDVEGESFTEFEMDEWQNRYQTCRSMSIWQNRRNILLAFMTLQRSLTDIAFTFRLLSSYKGLTTRAIQLWKRSLTGLDLPSHWLKNWFTVLTQALILIQLDILENNATILVLICDKDKAEELFRYQVVCFPYKTFHTVTLCCGAYSRSDVIYTFKLQLALFFNWVSTIFTVYYFFGNNCKTHKSFHHLSALDNILKNRFINCMATGKANTDHIINLEI